AARYIRVTATKLWKRTNDYVFALAELLTISNGENVAFDAKVSAKDSIEAGLWSRSHLVDGYSSRTLVAPKDGLKATLQKAAFSSTGKELLTLDRSKKELAEKL